MQYKNNIEYTMIVWTNNSLEVKLSRKISFFMDS